MEIITLDFSKCTEPDRRKTVEDFIKEKIMDEDNKSVIVGYDNDKGSDKVFNILLLKEKKNPLQWDKGRLIKYPIEEGNERSCLDYFRKFSCVFVLNKTV